MPEEDLRLCLPNFIKLSCTVRLPTFTTITRRYPLAHIKCTQRNVLRSRVNPCCCALPSYISDILLSTLHILPRVTLTIRLNHEQNWDFCWGMPLCSPILCACHWQLFGGTDNTQTPVKGDSPSLQQL